MSSHSGKPHLPFRNFVHFSEQEAEQLMLRMLSGAMTTEEIAEVLHFLRRKGETTHELTGFASAIRKMAEPVEIDQTEDPLLDTCGTGGDGTNTFNISTATAFVVAGAGLRVAKHGNRKISSQCGSADVLEALGCSIKMTARQVADCIAETGIGFLYAPLLHPAVKNAQEARLQLQGRTVFNMLGPLTNPVKARVQLMGAFSVRAAEMMAHAAARLGVERAFVVHGSDGLDEVTVTGPTTVFQVDEGEVQKGRWVPGDFGAPTARPEDLEGGDVETNATIIRNILRGERGPKREIVVANAAAALFLAKHAVDLRSAVSLAVHSIDGGSARRKLEQLVEYGAKLDHLQEQQTVQQ
jgi:anthranilate phosphoribosyltransferase